VGYDFVFINNDSRQKRSVDDSGGRKGQLVSFSKVVGGKYFIYVFYSAPFYFIDMFGRLRFEPTE
jgi:hypothetical protein